MTPVHLFFRGLRAIPARRGFELAAILAALPFVLAPQWVQGAASSSPRERINFDADWRFIKGDPTNVGEATSTLSYAAVKPWALAGSAAFTTNAASVPKPDGPEPGVDIAFTKPGFNDKSWRSLNLPHDWGIEGPFMQQYPGNTGRLPWWGVAWYRKHFRVASADKGKQFQIEIDGAMAYPSVWLNGKYVGSWPYGYSSFCLDLTPFIKPGADNVIAIRLDNPRNSSRWYPGGGIYRNVWLIKTAPVHVGQWGTYLTTPEVSRTAATVNLQVTLDNETAAETEATLNTRIFEADAAGRPIGKPMAALEPATLKIAAHASAAGLTRGTIQAPKLWNVGSPNMYIAVTTVERGGRAVDSYETPFGVRTIVFTSTNGFLVNGVRVPINGVCDHHDLGPIGTAINLRALERQIQILQEMGCNAIRTSHNMPAPELLDLCDRMGMLVMDESFDCWERGKNANDYGHLFIDWHERDLRAEVRRDRNHPSVIIWSVGNEVSEQGSPAGLRIAADLASIVHSEDTTRYVSAACNDTQSAFNGFQKIMDVFGYNYKPGDYGRALSRNPGLAVYGSETASTVSTRGFYTFPVATADSGMVVSGGGGGGGGRRGGRGGATNAPAGATNAAPPAAAGGPGSGRGGRGGSVGADASVHQISDYGLYHPGWATTPDAEFAGQNRNPAVAGEFVWTGFDYLGEPTPWGNGGDPSRSSYFGIVDLDGFKKDRFYQYQAHWRPDFPMAHILPDWNWPDRAGQVTPVHVFTSGDEAELFLNGKSLGRKKMGQFEYRLRWDDVVYEQGELRVIAYKNGQAWATNVVKTTGVPAQLSLQADRATIRADGADLSYVTVAIADKDGLAVPRSANHVAFKLSGPGEIIAVDNGDATSLVSFQDKERDAFSGLIQVIIRSTQKTGTITLKASSPDLGSAQLKIQARK